MFLQDLGPKTQSFNPRQYTRIVGTVRLVHYAPILLLTSNALLLPLTDCLTVAILVAHQSTGANFTLLPCRSLSDSVSNGDAWAKEETLALKVARKTLKNPMSGLPSSNRNSQG